MNSIITKTTRATLTINACRRIVRRIKETKAAIFAEWRLALMHRERMLRLALNEAEALAWQTRFPLLFFPSLAMEKVQNLAAWNDHQRAVRQSSLSSVMNR